MARRTTSLHSNTIGIDRDIGSAYDNVKLVADSIIDVNAIGLNIDDVIAIGPSIADVVVVSADIADVVTVSASIADVNTVATDIVAVQNAAANATAASNSASAASTSAANALTSENNAAAALNAINGLYLGSQASDPAVDLLGDPVTAGDWYFNTSSSTVRIYDGSVWVIGAVNANDYLFKSGGLVNMGANALVGTVSSAPSSPLSGEFSLYNDGGSGAILSGHGAFGDVALLDRNGATALKVGPNSVDITTYGSLTVSAGDLTLNGNMDISGNVKLENGQSVRFKDSGDTESAVLLLHTDDAVYLSSPDRLAFRTNGLSEGLTIDTSQNVAIPNGDLTLSAGNLAVSAGSVSINSSAASQLTIHNSTDQNATPVALTTDVDSILFSGKDTVTHNLARVAVMGSGSNWSVSTQHNAEADLVFFVQDNTSTDRTVVTETPALRLSGSTNLATFAADVTLTTGDLTLSAGDIVIGTEGTGLIRSVNTSYTRISGGSSVSSGANMLLQGGNTGVTSGDMTFRADGTAWFFYDHSATQLSVKNTSDFIVEAGDLTVSAGVITLGSNSNHLKGTTTGAAEKRLIGVGSDDNVYLNADGQGSTVVGSASGGSDLTVYNGDLTVSAGDATLSAGSAFINQGYLKVVESSGTTASDFFWARNHGDSADLVLRYDGAGTWDWRTEAAGAGSSVMSMVGAGVTFGGSVTASGNLTVSTGDLTVSAGDLITTDVHINTEGGGLIRTVDTSFNRISGGNAVASGANIALYGGTHATSANDFQIRSGSTTWFAYDDSLTTPRLTLSSDLWLDGTDLTVSAGDLTLSAGYMRVSRSAAPGVIFTDTANSVSYEMVAGTDKGILRTTTNHAMHIRTNSTDAIVISTAQDVTIPTGDLTVSAGELNVGTNVYLLGDVDTAGGTLGFETGANGPQLQFFGTNHANGGNFYVLNGGTQTAIFTGANDVQIPAGDLTVSAGNSVVTDGVLQVTTSNASNTPVQAYVTNASYTGAVYTSRSTRTANSAFSHMIFQSNGGASEEFRVAGDGKITNKGGHTISTGDLTVSAGDLTMTSGDIYANSSTIYNTSGVFSGSEIKATRVETNNGLEIIIAAGESALAVDEGSGWGEYVYLVAEEGLRIHSHSANWNNGSPDYATAWGERNTATICAANGTSTFPGAITIESGGLVVTADDITVSAGNLSVNSTGDATVSAVGGTAGFLVLSDTSAATNTKTWHTISDDGQLVVRSINDNASIRYTWLAVDTSGNGTFYQNNTFTGDVTLTAGDLTLSAGDLKVSAGFLNVGASSELTIATGAITVTQTRHKIDTEADEATDDLDTINGGSDGDIIILGAAHTDRTIVIKHASGGGNLRLAGQVDFSMDATSDKITLINDGGNWNQISGNNS